MDSAELLDRWVESVYEGTARALAEDELGVAESTLANWRSGVRSPSIGARELDAALGAEEMFNRLWWAASTRRTLPASLHWDRSFADSVFGPVWLWLRPQNAGTVSASIRCGVVEVRIDEFVGLDGLILTSPLAVNNPPVRVELSVPGWVDVGIGRPPSALRIPMHNALPLASSPRRPDPFVGHWAAHMRSRTGRSLKTLFRRALRLGIGRSEMDDAMSASARHLSMESALTPTVLPRVSPARFVDARKGRGLSQSSAAARLALLEGLSAPEITNHAISAFESSGAIPRSFALLPAALDAVYECQGALAALPYTTCRGSSEVRFPDWWREAVWIRSETGTEVELTWGCYRKAVRIEPGAAVWTRCADPSEPLRVDPVDDAALLTIGLGRLEGAHDVNDAWLPSGAEALRDIMRWGESLLARSAE